LAKTRLFEIESRQIAFPNGNITEFGAVRIQGDGVMVAAINDDAEKDET
jgi:hypothetical protein